jgi:tetratricopeptide (TPR) repeat protein
MAKHARPRVTKAGSKSTRIDRHAEPASRVSAAAVIALGGPTPDAVRAFDHGMRALQAHDYRDATEAFQKLIEGHPTERALLDRARVYLEVCARELRHPGSDPQTTEERLAAATAALNLGRENDTERLAIAVLREDPEQELALYLLAAVEARRGRRDDALSRLAAAIQVSPEVRAQARHDDDFEILRELDAFKLLTEGPLPAADEGIRSRRTRTGR